MSPVAKGSVAGLFALTQPVFTGLGDSEFHGSISWFFGEFIVRCMHHIVMTHIAEWLIFARAARAPLVDSILLKLHLSQL